MKRIIIITSYIDFPLDMHQVIRSDDFIICTDGGYDLAKKQNVTPDLLMGDFDSTSEILPDDIPVKRFNPEKDFTDLDLALKTAAEMEAANVIIIGGMGGRLDHTVANIQMLTEYTEHFSSLIMMDGNNKCFVPNSRHKEYLEIPFEKNSYLSLLPLSDRCTGVSISGVKYPLTGHTLIKGMSLGVSNEFIEEKAVLSVKNGTLLIIISKKE